MASEPKTLQEAILYFADADNCLSYLVARRWPNGVSCPTCGRTDVAFVPARRVWQCKTRHPKAQFSIKVGTIFEDSPISLDKWLLAMWMLANCKNGVSSYEISRATGISQKSCWFMLQRIRLALQDKHLGKMTGEIEVDESYVGGRARNMHRGSFRRTQVAEGGIGKEIVLGMVERGGKVRAIHVQKRSKPILQRVIREHIQAGSAIFTDALKSYDGLDEFEHKVIDHAVAYVDGKVHTNTVENFWSLVKRELKGTYISVEPFHLFRYLDEQAFRYNYRKDSEGQPVTDSERFDVAVRQIIGKRLTWAEVTGKGGETRATH
jgi:transposase-like protein